MPPLDRDTLARAVYAVDPVTGTPSSSSGTAASPTYTQPPIPATVVTGQVKIATTGTAVQLPSNALVNGIVIKLDPNASNKATIGGAGVTNTTDGTGNGYILSPGEAASFTLSNSNLIYVNGPAGAIFSYEGN